MEILSGRMCRHMPVNMWGMRSVIESARWSAQQLGSLLWARTSHHMLANRSGMPLDLQSDPQSVIKLVLRSAGTSDRAGTQNMFAIPPIYPQTHTVKLKLGNAPLLAWVSVTASAQMCRHMPVSMWGMRSAIESVRWSALLSDSLLSVRMFRHMLANKSGMPLARQSDPQWVTKLVLQSAGTSAPSAMQKSDTNPRLSPCSEEKNASHRRAGCGTGCWPWNK